MRTTENTEKKLKWIKKHRGQRGFMIDDVGAIHESPAGIIFDMKSRWKRNRILLRLTNCNIIAEE